METDAIIVEDLKNLDIEALAMNPEFGALTFDNANKKLGKIRDWLLEFTQLDYSNKLPEDIVSHINQSFKRFDDYIEWLRKFDISISINAKEEHDNFEKQIDGFYNEFFNPYVITHLSFLRQEADLKKEDKKRLKQEQKELVQLRKQSENLVKQLTKERQKILKETEGIEEAKGERAAISFGKHFERQAKDYKRETKTWLENRNKFFTWLFRIVITNFLVYLFLFVTNKLNWWPYLEPAGFFTLEYGVVNFALLTLLSYGVSFASRNYNVNSNLLAVNEHRKNVAETVKDFSESGLKEEDRSKVLDQGADAMFKHLPIGFLSKVESRNEGPITSLLNLLKR